ncbi:hypothetical protein MAM1_0313d09558 [Mucor ambiguus]|uniref:BAG domain-containing protein n=1 Tax=Mucor ambiguus TaxID=91626 RepID=A0A0C9MRC3_9FUNG|nr:hypothetical protein MAM1_0313d09558 [Mucor ambiguus]
MSTIVLSEDNLTLDDFLQLQSLLNHEQGECDKHIEACHQQQQQHHPKPHVHPAHHHHGRPIKFRRAISSQAAHESQLEKERLAQALLTLHYLKDQYRRQRAAEIQAYLNEYRRQALISSILQEEEERYYRQCIAAALEQRRVNLLWQQFLQAKKQEALIQQLQRQEVCEQLEQQQQEQVLKEEEEEEEEDDDGYSEYHSQQLALLLRQIFAQQQQQQQAEDEEEASPPSSASAPAANVNVSSKSEDDEQKSMAEVWKYLNEQKADSETPRNAFLSSEQDRVLGSGDASPQQEEQIAETSPQDEQQETESIGSPASILSDQDQIKALPPLQDHVVTLQDLIQKLAAEPVLVGEEYNKGSAPAAQSFNKQEPLKEHTLPTPLDTSRTTARDIAASAATATADSDKDEKDVEQDKTKKPFLPQHIFTEAEPTPTLESMPNTPLDNASIKDDAHFVDTIAAEQQNQEIPVDPRKEKANEELDHISDQLSHNSDLVQRWNSVLSHENNLSFSKQPEGTLLLTASTDANRQFLGSEDEIMRVMLKLDSIDSFGDDSIRQKRKSLVKKCEHMLEELDQVKKTQWEKVVSSNKQGQNNRRRRNKKKHHRK